MMTETEHATPSEAINKASFRIRLAAQPALTFYTKYRALILLITIPLVCSIVPIIFSDSVGLCAYVVLLMSCYWVVLCVPIAVTSFVPVILFPIFGIMSSEKVSAVFFNVRKKLIYYFLFLFFVI